MELRCILNAVFVAYCILLCEIRAKADVSCTAGKFIAGSQGVVRCDFGIDVTKDKHNFNVVWYDFDDTSYSLSRKNLLACSWYIDRLDCTVKASGYEFDKIVDSTLTLVIPVVDKSMAGLYRCQLVPKPPDIQMHFCNLTVIADDGVDLCGETTTMKLLSSNQYESGGHTIMAVAMGLSIFICVLLILGFCCLWKRYRLISRTAGPGRDDWVNILICCQPCQKKPSQSTAGEDASPMIRVLGHNDKCVSTEDEHTQKLEEALDNIKIAQLRAADESTQGEAENSPESTQPTDTIEGSNPHKPTTASDDRDGLNEITRSGECQDAFKFYFKNPKQNNLQKL